jgi:hypothetical protein
MEEDAPPDLKKVPGAFRDTFKRREGTGEA